MSISFCKAQIYVHFLSLLNNETAKMIKKSSLHNPIDAYFEQAVSWVPMSWRRKEPGH